MRTTLDLDADLMKKVVRASGAKTKKKAIEMAMKEFLRAKQREELSNLIGHYDDFDLSLDKLERMRRGS